MSMLPDSLFPGIHTVALTPDHRRDLQRFFDENPAYFIATTGAAASPDAALEELTDRPPDGWTFTTKWVIGYVNPQGAIVAMAHVIGDLLARSVFHVGTFIVATELHGQGIAQGLYGGLEQWSAAHGAAWMRLGVVAGNARAERFWTSRGYLPVVERPGIRMGDRSVTVRNMVKPLQAADLEAYFALVSRDRP